MRMTPCSLFRSLGLQLAHGGGRDRLHCTCHDGQEEDLSCNFTVPVRLRTDARLLPGKRNTIH